MVNLQELFKIRITPVFDGGNKEMAKAIDWTNPKSKIGKYFTVKDACWLPTWKKLHSPTEQEKANILRACAVLDTIRDFIGRPINVHCWIRPTEYNKLIGGAPQSMHLYGLAVDFDCSENCDATRAKLLQKLAEWDIRMEDKPNSSWVHIDLKPIPATGIRFFKP